MLLSRFWYIVLAAVAALAIAGAVIVRNTYEHDRGRDSETLLRSDRQQIENLLRTDARVRLDNLAPVAANPDLTLLMVQARDRAPDAPLTDLARRISAQLRTLNEQLGEAARGQMLLAVDPRGVLVGRTGLNENSSIGEYVGGHPLIARALDGYVRDDTWEIQGRVFRMAARPVIDRGRYAGAVVHAREIDNAFVQHISEALGGPTVAFFASTGIFASHPGEADRGRPAPPVAVLSEQVSALPRDRNWRGRGWTDVLEVQHGQGAAVFGAIAGSVGAAGGGFAVGRPRPVLPPDYLLHAPADEVRRVPWPGIIGFLVGASVLGLLFVYLEHDRGDKKLHQMLRALAERKIDRLDPLTLRGGARRMALAINEAFERAMKEELARAGAAPRRTVEDLDALLGPPSAEPQAMPFADIPPPPPPAARPAAMPPPPPAPRIAGGGAPPAGTPPMGTAAPPPTPVAARPPPAPAVTPDTSGPISTVGESAQCFASAAEEQAHWRDIFEQFVATKKQCGEPTDALVFDKFASTLQRHKDQLMQRTGCRAVRFQVYVKDGKATLKASPVK
jgi:hypothetical protein